MCQTLRCLCFQLWECIKIYILGVVVLLMQSVYGYKEHRACEEVKYGMVAIVTGGARGIGLQTAHQLASKGVHVVIGGHHASDGEEAVATILRTSPQAKVEWHTLDLSDLSSIREFAEWFIRKDVPLHLLINNAGVMLEPYHCTQDGFESHFGINYLGHFYLTHLLLAKLEESNHHGNPSHIINVSSHVHYIGNIQWDDLNGSQCYSSHAAYCQSKLAIVMSTYQLNTHLHQRGSKVKVNCLHPGVVDTQLYHNVHWLLQLLQYPLNKTLFWTPTQGATTTLYLALSGEQISSGGYYANSSPIKSSTSSYYTKDQEHLWNLSCEMLGIDENWS